MQSSRKQPSRRLEKRENSRRWLLIPALCAAVILAVVLIVELNKQLALWLHPALSYGPDGCHWNRV